MELKNFEKRLFPWVRGFQLFLIEEGDIGIVAGKCNVQKRDEIWLFSLGGLTPFVLRKRSRVVV